MEIIENTSNTNSYFYKKLLTRAWSQMFKEQDWTLFACTIVFKPIDKNNSQARWESEYKERVLWKFKRRLERSPKLVQHAIPLEDFYYFERFETSVLKRRSSRKSPFHIHALIPIRCYQARRIWSFDNNCPNARLSKDVESLDVVQNFDLQLIKDRDPTKWIRYITKGKSM